MLELLHSRAVGPKKQSLSFKVYVTLNSTFAREGNIVYIFWVGNVIQSKQIYYSHKYGRRTVFHSADPLLPLFHSICASSKAPILILMVNIVIVVRMAWVNVADW